jgi:tetratricopeptide (TPR) repeat protein
MAKNFECQAIQLNQDIQKLLGKSEWVSVIERLRGEHHLLEISWELLWSLGWAYSKIDNFQDAEKHLLQATLIAPDNHICNWALGVTYFDLQQYQKAEVSLSKALQIKDGAIARLFLAIVYMEQGKLNEAENVHVEGLRLKPDSRKRYEAYGDFLSDVNREKEAQEMYRRADEAINP